MRAKISDELKNEILKLPIKEKNSLLIRLIKKDDLLSEQLNFRLLEVEEDLKERQYNLVELIETTMNERYRTAKQLNSALRRLSAKITRHQRVTNDKYGEIEYSLLMLNFVVKKHSSLILELNNRNIKLGNYIVSKTQTLLKKVKNLHPDIQFDFKKDFDTLFLALSSLGTNALLKEKNLTNEF